MELKKAGLKGRYLPLDLVVGHTCMLLVSHIR